MMEQSQLCEILYSIVDGLVIFLPQSKRRCGQILGPQIERRRFSHPSTNPISPKSMYSEYSSISFFISGTT